MFGMLVLPTNIAEACDPAIALSSVLASRNARKKNVLPTREPDAAETRCARFCHRGLNRFRRCPAFRRPLETLAKSIDIEKRNRLT
jgi:hypothetical protein